MARQALFEAARPGAPGTQGASCGIDHGPRRQAPRMTRADLAARLETGTAAVPDGAAVLVASDGLRDFADPLRRGSAPMLTLLADAPDAAAAARGLVEFACADGAGDNVAVALARNRDTHR